MSGAGRGTPRVSPVAGSPAPIPVTPGEDVVMNFWTVTPGPWGVSVEPETESQVLTAEYVLYGADDIVLPVGIQRISLACLYSPGQTGGSLGIYARWRGGSPPDTSYALVTPDLGTVTPVTTENQVVETSVYADAVATPPTPGEDNIQYLIPFWVPCLAPFQTQGDLTRTFGLNIYVREASAGAPGTVSILRVIGDTYGQPQPVARR